MGRQTSSANTTLLSLGGTLDWTALFSCLVVLITACLLIVNGRCSRPRGDIAQAELCVGSQLSIQAWLAITGLEFSLIGTILVPRITSITVSKIFTHRLTSPGLPLSAILNSLPTAPLETQIRSGLKRVLFLRALVIAMVAAISVLYKFSFVRVAAYDVVPVLAATNSWENYTPMGDSDIPSTDDSVTRLLSNTILSSNFVDMLAMNNDSTRFFGTGLNFVSSTDLASKSADLVLGPKLNNSRIAQILNGTVQSCDALLYSRHTITARSILQDVGRPAFFTWPTSRINNSVRIEALLFNATNNPNYIQGGLMDLRATSNGSLQAYSGSIFPTVKNTAPYSDSFNVTSKYCYGYNSWSNARSDDRRFEIEDPQDLQCIIQTFDASAWNSSQNGYIAQRFIQNFMAAQTQYYDAFWYSGLSIILAIQDRPVPFSKSLPRNPLCSSFESQGAVFAVASGFIGDHRTGMTVLGIALQALALVLALWALGTLLVPTLPLISEWPAQWLGIVGSLDRDEIAAAVEGTSGGQNWVQRSLHVYLTSQENTEIGKPPVLRLTKTAGGLQAGVRHL
jgi:hypothetical protein